jgi:hypothetical protein
MILESDHRPKRMGEPMSTVVCSPISHRKLSSRLLAIPTREGGASQFSFLSCRYSAKDL